MNCIYCKKGKTKVTDAASSKTSIIRRRECLVCSKVFFTEEKTGDYKLLCSEMNSMKETHRALRKIEQTGE